MHEDVIALSEGARWRLAEQVAATGIPAAAIDGGMQWFSFHEQAPGLGAQQVPTRPGRPWWTERYPDRPVCATVTILANGAAPPADALVVREAASLLGAPLRLAVLPGPDACS